MKKWLAFIFFGLTLLKAGILSAQLPMVGPNPRALFSRDGDWKLIETESYPGTLLYYRDTMVAMYRPVGDELIPQSPEYKFRGAEFSSPTTLEELKQRLDLSLVPRLIELDSSNFIVSKIWEKEKQMFGCSRDTEGYWGTETFYGEEIWLNGRQLTLSHITTENYNEEALKAEMIRGVRIWREGLNGTLFVFWWGHINQSIPNLWLDSR